MGCQCSTLGGTCLSVCLKEETHSDHNYNTEVIKTFGTNASECAFTFAVRLYDKKKSQPFYPKSQV